MTQIFFLTSLYIIGLSFGICFKKWIPIKFIALSGFLWGSIIFSMIQLLIYILGFNLNSIAFMVLLSLVLIVFLLMGVITNRVGLAKQDWITIFFIFLNFTLLNLLFVYFSFSVATPDSFVFLRLSRIIAFYGFNTTIIEWFSSWGVLIPIMQSVSAFLSINYLDTLQFSFAISFAALFFYFCENLSFKLLQNKKISISVSILFTIMLITTPMYMIQFFYIHSNLTTAIFFCVAIFCGWMAISENNNYWLIFFSISLIGVNLSRAESFIYSILLILLLLFTTKILFKARLFAFVPNILVQICWFIYLMVRMETGSKILNPQRMVALVVFLILIIGLIVISNSPFLSKTIFPRLQKYFLLLFFLGFLILVMVKPGIMIESLINTSSNLLFTGQWGISYWLIILALILNLSKNKLELETFFINILCSSILLIIGLVFLRNPYHLGWTDSANRLMTIGLPIGLLLLSVSLSRWLAPNINRMEVSANNEN